jgi:hypothetical protein
MAEPGRNISLYNGNKYQTPWAAIPEDPCFFEEK